MKLLSSEIALFAAFAFVGCAAEAAPSATTTSAAISDGPVFTWPVAAGWRSETIPFPLGFAPTITHRGTEELRFGPKFFDPKSPTYFTYSFAFVTDDKAPITASALAADLQTYFQGLASAVTGAPSDPSLHDATIVDDVANTMHGTVHTIDGFGDKRALTLHLVARSFTCGEKHIVLTKLSPSGDPAIWTALDEVAASFSCTR